jgi:hypothetical protein
MTTTAPATDAGDEFASLIAEFKPAAPAAAAGWVGPLPASVVKSVDDWFAARTSHEVAMTDNAKADRLSAAIRAVCEQHTPKLSARITRVYAPLVRDGKPVTEDGKPVDDETQLRALRVSISPYSPRGGGKRAAAKESTTAPAPAAPKPGAAKAKSV